MEQESDEMLFKFRRTGMFMAWFSVLVMKLNLIISKLFAAILYVDYGDFYFIY